jgi:chromate transporter
MAPPPGNDLGHHPLAVVITWSAQARAWFLIGAQSFGGGSAALYLMRRELVTRRGWVTESEFTDAWAISRVSPGVHLVAHAALLGLQIGGRRGLTIALAAMLLPSALLTVAFTLALVAARSSLPVDSAVSGVAPAAIGLTIGVASTLARSAARPGRARYADAAVVAVAVLLGSLRPALTLPLTIGGAIVGLLLLRGVRLTRHP